MVCVSFLFRKEIFPIRDDPLHIMCNGMGFYRE